MYSTPLLLPMPFHLALYFRIPKDVPSMGFFSVFCLAYYCIVWCVMLLFPSPRIYTFHIKLPPIEDRIRVRRLDWNLLSTATPAIKAWMNPTHNLTEAVTDLLKRYKYRLNTVMACIMTEALEVQGIHVPAKVGRVSWCIMVYHGVSWCIVVYRGVSWCIMVYHGVSCCTMVYHGVSWCIVVCHGVSLCIVVYRGVSCCTMVYHGVSWCIMVYHGVSWCIMLVYRGVSWCIMVYRGVSWCTTLYHGV